MQTTKQMLSSKTRKASDGTAYAACIDACVECEVVCSACADGCLGEQDIDALRRCIRLDLDCADLCGTTARLLARATDESGEALRATLTACMRACAACARECERHDMQHCQICAQVCRRCEESCRQLESGVVSAA